VPLVARRRVTASVGGAPGSARRGRPGQIDAARNDDRAAAWLSSAPGREQFAERATRVVLVRDRCLSTALFPRWLPRFSKPHACRALSRLLAASARQAGCTFRDEDDVPVHALEDLALCRLGRGSFFFMVSDFLVPPPEEAWREALQRDWDIVPVVLQDPVWERSFPKVAGVVLPVWDQEARRLRPTLLTLGECAARRTANEQRFRAICEQFDRLGLDPILLGRYDNESVWRAFHDWSEARRLRI
jgi:hypothetical protein